MFHKWNFFRLLKPFSLCTRTRSIWNQCATTFTYTICRVIKVRLMRSTGCSLIMVKIISCSACRSIGTISELELFFEFFEIYRFDYLVFVVEFIEYSTANLFGKSERRVSETDDQRWWSISSCWRCPKQSACRMIERKETMTRFASGSMDSTLRSYALLNILVNRSGLHQPIYYPSCAMTCVT